MIFVDTSGWAAAVDRTQVHHAKAGLLLNQARAAGIKLVTTNLVLAELTALLTRPIRMTRPQQIIYLNSIRSAGWVEIIHVDTVMEADAWRLWENRPDKERSFVDCSSFIVMPQRGLTEAITSVHHFEQAGFVRLLK